MIPWESKKNESFILFKKRFFTSIKFYFSLILKNINVFKSTMLNFLEFQHEQPKSLEGKQLEQQKRMDQLKLDIQKKQDKLQKQREIRQQKLKENLLKTP